MEFQIRKCTCCKDSFIASIDNFFRKRNSLTLYCKKCSYKKRTKCEITPESRKVNTAYHREYYAKNKSKIDTHNRNMQEKDPTIKIKTSIRAKKWNAELSDGAVKARIKRDIKRSENVVIDHADISPEFVELQRKRILLKRNLKTVKQNSLQ